MITIPAVNIGTSDEPILSPASPLPADRIAVVCDGVNYIVYEPGDEIPQ